jgi:hypothetical protein
MASATTKITEFEAFNLGIIGHPIIERIDFITSVIDHSVVDRSHA